MKLATLTALLAASSISTVLAAPIVITVKEIVYIDGTLTYTSTSSPLPNEIPTPTPTLTPTSTPTAGFDDPFELPDAVIGVDGAVGVPETAYDNTNTNTNSPVTSTTSINTPETSAVRTTLEPSPATPATTTTAQQQQQEQVQETSVTEDSNNDNFSSSMTNVHNAKRSLHVDTGSLTWSEELAAYAQNYADQYDCSGNLVHSGGPYGENLALGYGLTGAVDAWYDEISKYNYDDPGYSPQTGHFTQVVWKSSTQVGCGYKYCGSYWGDYVVCEYAPAGNVIGEFAENVMPLK